MSNEIFEGNEKSLRTPVQGFRKVAIVTGATILSLVSALGPQAKIGFAQEVTPNITTTEAINTPHLNAEQLFDDMGISPLDQKVNYQAFIMAQVGQKIPQYIDRISSFSKRNPSPDGGYSYIFDTREDGAKVEIRTVTTPNGEVVTYKSAPLDIVKGAKAPTVDKFIAQFGDPTATVPYADDITFYNFGGVTVFGEGSDDPAAQQVIKVEEMLQNTVALNGK